MSVQRVEETVEEWLKQRLQPLVRTIDAEGNYPGEFLKEMFSESYVWNRGEGDRENENLQALALIEKTAAVCGSTAFAVWCHTAAMLYIRNGQSDYLKNEILPKLENGQLLGGTGLSNPMKYYGGLERLHLKAEPLPDGDGYQVHGTLPFISNLGQDHWFGIIAEVSGETSREASGEPSSRRIMALIPCHAAGLTMEERVNFLGLNGTATYTCRFDGVRVGKEWILAENADSLVNQIRSGFVVSQIGLSLGLTRSAIDCMYRMKQKQNGANQYLPVQPEGLESRWITLREKAYHLAKVEQFSDEDWREVLQARLESAYLALDAAQADFLHCGGAGYLFHSDPSRRLREAYFVAVVTPSVKHLEKLLQVCW